VGHDLRRQRRPRHLQLDALEATLTGCDDTVAGALSVTADAFCLPPLDASRLW
jgi:hypothetical protein